MSDSPLSAQDIRAAAEVHRELGPDYGDAVVESFLSKIDAHIEQRIQSRLTSLSQPAPVSQVTQRPVDPARLSKQREALTAAVIGSVVAGVPVTVFAWYSIHDAGGNPAPLLLIWLVLVIVYGVAAYPLRRH